MQFDALEWKMMQHAGVPHAQPVRTHQNDSAWLQPLKTILKIEIIVVEKNDIQRCRRDDVQQILSRLKN